MPSLIIVLFLAYLYGKYRDLSIMKNVLHRLRPVVVALVASAGLTIFRLALFGENGGLADIRYVELGLFALALLVLRKTKISSILVLLGSAALGTVIYLLVL